MIRVEDDAARSHATSTSPRELGMTALHAGNLDAALDHLQEALRLQPGAVDLLHDVGLVWHRQKKHAEAINCWQQLLASNPELPDTWLCLGHAKRETGKLSEASAHYREVIRLRPAAPEGHFYLGARCGTSARWTPPPPLTRSAFGSSPTTLKRITTWDWPCRPWASPKRPKRATARRCGKIPRTRRRSITWESSWRPGQLQEAVGCFQESLELRPESPETLSNLGVALVGLGKHEEALELYQKALRCKPDFPDAHNNLGNVLRDLGRIDEAISHFEEALRLKADYPEAHNNVGIARSQQGNIKEAVAGYERALPSAGLSRCAAKPRAGLAGIRRVRQGLARVRVSLARQGPPAVLVQGATLGRLQPCRTDHPPVRRAGPGRYVAFHSLRLARQAARRPRRV